jgi:hypothetical protein
MTLTIYSYLRMLFRGDLKEMKMIIAKMLRFVAYDVSEKLNEFSFDYKVISSDFEIKSKK